MGGVSEVQWVRQVGNDGGTRGRDTKLGDRKDERESTGPVVEEKDNSCSGTTKTSTNEGQSEEDSFT